MGACEVLRRVALRFRQMSEQTAHAGRRVENARAAEMAERMAEELECGRKAAPLSAEACCG
jgi:hypothetical protein